jgi:hypothetical protein
MNNYANHDDMASKYRLNASRPKYSFENKSTSPPVNSKYNTNFYKQSPVRFRAEENAK